MNQAAIDRFNELCVAIRYDKHSVFTELIEAFEDAGGALDIYGERIIQEGGTTDPVLEVGRVLFIEMFEYYFSGVYNEEELDIIFTNVATKLGIE